MLGRISIPGMRCVFESLLRDITVCHGRLYAQADIYEPLT
jgi:hypothetical protein